MSASSFDTSDVDQDRRRFLTASATVAGAVGAAAVAVPFVSSMWPSERVKTAGAPVEVDISKIQPGMKITIQWRGKPVWVVRRTQEMLDSLAALDPVLVDPNSSNLIQQPTYTINPHRSIKPEYLVMVGLCTHLGCSPTYRPEIAPQDLGTDWRGGFFCPCHGSKFDLSGRVYKGMPAPDNMEIPPYKYLSDSVVLIGEDQEVA